MIGSLISRRQPYITDSDPGQCSHIWVLLVDDALEVTSDTRRSGAGYVRAVWEYGFCLYCGYIAPEDKI